MKKCGKTEPTNKKKKKWGEIVTSPAAGEACPPSPGVGLAGLC